MKTGRGGFSSFRLPAGAQGMREGSDPKGETVTFVAVADGIEVDVVLLATDEEQAEPGVKGVHWHDEENADDVALLVGDGVGPKMRIDLPFKKERKETR